MTSNWTSLFVAGSLLFVTTQIAAEEHAVLGQGNVSCGSWLNDRRGEDAASSRIAWVLGYVTGYSINTDPSQKVTYPVEKVPKKS